MIAVFKTNIRNKQLAKIAMTLLKREFQFAEINFDLDDCDKVLRVKDEEISGQKIINLLTSYGFQCQVLD